MISTLLDGVLIFFAWVSVNCLGGNRLLSSKCDFIRPLFGIEKVDKRFSPLKRRSESAATWRISL